MSISDIIKALGIALSVIAFLNDPLPDGLSLSPDLHDVGKWTGAVASIIALFITYAITRTQNAKADSKPALISAIVFGVLAIADVLGYWYFVKVVSAPNRALDVAQIALWSLMFVLLSVTFVLVVHVVVRPPDD